MRKIKVRHLDTLLAFMKTGSVTEAAKLMATTQPNASKSLQQLEEFVGVALFQRIGGRLRPTVEAEMLFPRAVRLVEELNAFETMSADLVGLKSGIVSIAVLATFATAVVPMATTRFHAQYPDVLVQVDILDSDKIHSFISRGNYDFGLVHHPEHEPDLMAQTLSTAAMVLITPIGHPLAANRSVIASDLIGAPFITYPRSLPFGAAIHRALVDEGLRPAPVLMSNQSQMIRRLVIGGCGVALIDEFAVWDVRDGDQLHLRRFEPRVPISIGMLVPKRRPLSLAAQAYVRHLTDVLQAPPAAPT